jgi:hypothetical protein
VTIKPLRKRKNYIRDGTLLRIFLLLDNRILFRYGKHGWGEIHIFPPVEYIIARQMYQDHRQAIPSLVMG